MSVGEALTRAEAASLDLVIVAEKSDPPVCRILDFGKLAYAQKRKHKDQKKKQTSQKLKEIKFHVNIEKHDYDFKVNHANEFLSKGCKVKLSLIFRGREAANKDVAFDIMNRMIADLKSVGQSDGSPVLSGRIMAVSISPITGK